MAETKPRAITPGEAIWQRQAPAARKPAVGRTVLVIEPNALARDLYRLALRPLQCAIMHAESGEQALTAARWLRPDLILMELVLPGLSALETLAALEAEPGFATIPIIAISSLNPADVLPAAAMAELAANFPKPVDSPRLLATVHRLLA